MGDGPPPPGALRDEDRREAAVPVAVEIYPARDAADGPAGGVLPERPPVAAPVVRRDARRRAGRPVRDPQDLVAGLGEVLGVARVVGPEAGRDVDGALDARAGVHPVE